jgi:hypothetical protein
MCQIIGAQNDGLVNKDDIPLEENMPKEPNLPSNR